MLGNSLTIGHVAGIRIAVHYTWLLAFLLISWSLAAGYFPAMNRGWEPAAYWAAGIAAGLILFASVLLHELGHSLVALSRRVRVSGITLYIFGGVSALEDEPSGPGDEFLIAVAGPLTSFALAGAFWGLSELVPAASPPAAVLSYSAMLNLILGLFNLLPGFPLDGGRVVRALIWGVTGSLRRATQVASYVGQGIGILLIVWGLAQVLGGGFLDGLWTAFIGWFLNGAAEQARQAQALRESLAGVPVRALMDAQPATASPRMSLEEFVDQHVIRRGQRALPVVEEGRLVGLVCLADAREVPRDAWPVTPVQQVMTRVPLTSVTPRTGLDTALALLAEGDFHQLPVVDDAGHLVGMLSRSDVLRYLRYRDLIRAPGDGGLESGASRA
ncbi:MAG TPA: site-2 protease family protein [Chloroflexota bacterium]|jgi:Zn-dependent protease|nr:site-2 protease family protein [Chloroflexota bacterium]